MASKKALISVTKFNEGLQTARPDWLVPDGAATRMVNVDLGRNFDGVLSKRRGYVTKHGEHDETAFPHISGLWQFIRFDAGEPTGTSGSSPTPDVTTRYLYASANEDVYEVVGDVYTSRYHNDAINGTNINFATFNNLLVMVNENTSTQRGQGGAAFSTLLGTPPANGKYIKALRDRVFIANTSAGNSRLHWSAAGNVQDWVTVGDAGFVDISPGDGDEITGIEVNGECLVITKKHSTYVLTGFKPDNFVLYKVPNVEGCLGPRTLVDHGPFVIYGGSTGIWIVGAQGGTHGALTPLIHYEYEALSETVKRNACGGIYKNRQYWYCYDSDGDGINDAAYVINLLPEISAWTHYTNIKAAIFLLLDDTEFISGGSEKAIIRTHESGDSDEGAIIPFEWHSKEHDFGSVFDFKKLLDFRISAGVLAGKTITVRTVVDGEDSGDILTIPLTQTLGVNQRFVTKLSKMLQVQQGRTIQFVFTNNEADAPIEIYEYAAQVEIIQDQFSD